MNKREGEDTLRTGFTLRTTDECDSARSADFGEIREEASNELKAFVELRTIVRNASQVRIFKYEIEKKKTRSYLVMQVLVFVALQGFPIQQDLTSQRLIKPLQQSDTRGLP